MVEFVAQRELARESAGGKRRRRLRQQKKTVAPLRAVLILAARGFPPL
jgi:hypothetical protein